MGPQVDHSEWGLDRIQGNCIHMVSASEQQIVGSDVVAYQRHASSELSARLRSAQVQQPKKKGEGQQEDEQQSDKKVRTKGSRRDGS